MRETSLIEEGRLLVEEFVSLDFLLLERAASGEEDIANLIDRRQLLSNSLQLDFTPTVLGFYYCLLYNRRAKQVSPVEGLSSERRRFLWANAKEPFALSHFRGFSYPAVLSQAKAVKTFAPHFFRALLLEFP